MNHTTENGMQMGPIQFGAPPSFWAECLSVSVGYLEILVAKSVHRFLTRRIKP